MGAVAVHTMIAERQLDFSIDTAASSVRAHDWALRELTRNLLHNAIKLSPPGSPLSVTLEHSHDKARLVLADGGPGISPRQRQHLFQPFARGAGADDTVQGSGLGLAICHDIVQSLGGNIALDNRVEAQCIVGLDAIVNLLEGDGQTERE